MLNNHMLASGYILDSTGPDIILSTKWTDGNNISYESKIKKKTKMWAEW